MLYGADPFESFAVDADIERFLSEQALRNVRLRLVRGFIVFGKNRLRYTQFLIHWIPTIFIDLSAALRLGGTEIPHDFSDRIDVLGRGFETDASVLRDLLALKERPPRPSLDLRLIWGRRLSSDDIARYHERVFVLLTRAIEWMEARWPSDGNGGGEPSARGEPDSREPNR